VALKSASAIVLPQKPVTQGLISFERVVKVLREIDLLETMFIVEGSRKGHVRFQKVDIEHKRLIAMPPQEFHGLVSEKSGLTVLNRKTGGEGTTEVAPGRFRLIPPFSQEVPVRAFRRLIPIRPIETPVRVLDSPPLLEAVLCENLISQMPLAHVSSAIVRVIQDLGQARDSHRERDVVFNTAARVRP
jgi:hypothetical protein